MDIIFDFLPLIIWALFFMWIWRKAIIRKVRKMFGFKCKHEYKLYLRYSDKALNEVRSICRCANCNHVLIESTFENPLFEKAKNLSDAYLELKRKHGIPTASATNLSLPWHQVLGVRRDASLAQAKAAYRVLQKHYHPDISGSDQMSRQLNAALEAAQKVCK